MGDGVVKEEATYGATEGQVQRVEEEDAADGEEVMRDDLDLRRMSAHAPRTFVSERLTELRLKLNGTKEVLSTLTMACPAAFTNASCEAVAFAWLTKFTSPVMFVVSLAAPYARVPTRLRSNKPQPSIRLERHLGETLICSKEDEGGHPNAISGRENFQPDMLQEITAVLEHENRREGETHRLSCCRNRRRSPNH